MCVVSTLSRTLPGGLYAERTDGNMSERGCARFPLPERAAANMRGNMRRLWLLIHGREQRRRRRARFAFRELFVKMGGLAYF